MKKKWILLIAAGLIAISAQSGCSGQSAAPESTAPARTADSRLEESDSSPKESEAKEGSSEPESSAPSAEEQKAAKKETETEEIRILLQYKQELAAAPEQTYTGQHTEINRQKDNTIKPVDISTDHTLKYLDAVIRDVNEDGHYEMIVRYLDSSLGSVFLYDLVTIVDGKAVPSNYYLYGESFMTGAGSR